MENTELKKHFEKQLPSTKLINDVIRYIEDYKTYWHNVRTFPTSKT